MSVAETSLENYFDNQKKFDSDRGRVLHIIRKKGPVTGGQIAKTMQKPYHAISGRITKLLENQRIEKCGTTENRFGNTVRKYRVKQ